MILWYHRVYTFQRDASIERGRLRLKVHDFEYFMHEHSWLPPSKRTHTRPAYLYGKRNMHTSTFVTLKNFYSFSLVPQKNPISIDTFWKREKIRDNTYARHVGILRASFSCLHGDMWRERLNERVSNRQKEASDDIFDASFCEANTIFCRDFDCDSPLS